MPSPPSTPTYGVVDTLHGERIPDPYRWLEDGDSAETQAWTAAQNRFTRDYLDRVPARAHIRSRLEQLLKIGALSPPTPVRGRYFYQRREGTQNQPVLYVRVGVEGPDRVLLDPNALDAAGTTALDWYFPSEDGKLLAYGLSENGSEESVLHVLEVDTGELRRIGLPAPARRTWPGCPTAAASTTPATRWPERFPRGKSSIIAPCFFTFWELIRRKIGSSSSRSRKSIGRVSTSHPMAAGC